jgi:hypothetical protein
MSKVCYYVNSIYLRAAFSKYSKELLTPLNKNYSRQWTFSRLINHVSNHKYLRFHKWLMIRRMTYVSIIETQVMRRIISHSSNHKYLWFDAWHMIRRMTWVSLQPITQFYDFLCRAYNATRDLWFDAWSMFRRMHRNTSRASNHESWVELQMLMIRRMICVSTRDLRLDVGIIHHS